MNRWKVNGVNHLYFINDKLRYTVCDWYGLYFTISYHDANESKILNKNGLLSERIINMNFNHINDLFFDDFKFKSLKEAKTIVEKHAKNILFL